MAQLRQDYPQFIDYETEVIVIGPEGIGQFTKFWRENNLPFIGIPDPKHTVLKQYGQEVKLFKFGRMPAQVIINKQGIVRFVHYGDSMADIPDNKEMLEILKKLP
jgi:peroxiredoxin